jgi:hypothetical protein
MMTADKAYERAERGVSVVWWVAFLLEKAPSLAEIRPSLVVEIRPSLLVSGASGGNALNVRIVL